MQRPAEHWYLGSETSGLSRTAARDRSCLLRTLVPSLVSHRQMRTGSPVQGLAETSVCPVHSLEEKASLSWGWKLRGRHTACQGHCGQSALVTCTSSRSLSVQCLEVHTWRPPPQSFPGSFLRAKEGQLLLRPRPPPLQHP